MPSSNNLTDPTNKSKSRLVLFLIAIGFWIFAFRGFIFNKLALTVDALPYFEHTKFYLDQIIRGIYPLWDPSREEGFPTEFMLRRIGSYNPLYFLIVLLVSVFKMPFNNAYITFLFFYYFLGIFGFYNLSYILYKNKDVAFLASLLLMFSSFFCILFNSFLILLFTPMVWFFYFMYSFTERQNKFSLMAMTSCIMLLMITYIPFYFLTVFIIILLFYSFLYPKSLSRNSLQYLEFIRTNKLLFCLCGMLVVMSVVPGYLFFQEAKQASFVLPWRHMHIDNPNSVTVAKQTTATGGVVAINFLHEFFSNLKNFQLGVVYFPFFTHILFALGLLACINRRIILITLSAALLYLISVHGAAPLYNFLYDHVFFFKYFRNFQFFLWLIIVPAYILISVEHFNQFIQITPSDLKRKKAFLCTIIVIHVGFFVFLQLQQNVIWTTYAILLLSGLFFIAYIKGWIIEKNKRFLILIFLITIIQPMEVFGYLHRNAEKKNFRYAYESKYMRFPFASPYKDYIFEESQAIRSNSSDTTKTMDLTRPKSYMSTTWYYKLQKIIGLDLTRLYLDRTGKVVLYDRVEVLNDEEKKGEYISKVFLDNKNVAFVAEEEALEFMPEPPLNIQQEAQLIYEDSKHVQLMSFDVNETKFKTNLKEKKFFVYNDNYYRGWRAYINSKEVPVYRANVAFKGIWVPPGENVVRFHFGSKKRYIFDYFYVVLYCFTLIALVVLGTRQFRLKNTKQI